MTSQATCQMLRTRGESVSFESDRPLNRVASHVPEIVLEHECCRSARQAARNLLACRSPDSKLHVWPDLGCIKRRIFLCSRFLPRNFSKVCSFCRRHYSSCEILFNRKW